MRVSRLRALWLVCGTLAGLSLASAAQASPVAGAKRIFSGGLEALEAFAIDIDRDGSDELVVIGDGEIGAYSASGAIMGTWPLAVERPVIAKFATGYYAPASGELVFRTSSRLGGNRLAFATKAISWDAEPNYPMCVGEALRLGDDQVGFVRGEQRMRRLRCGELLYNGRRLQWTGTLSLLGALHVAATWCGVAAGASCEAPSAWGPFADSGIAFTVGLRDGKAYVAVANGKTLSVWGVGVTTRKAVPLWSGRFAGGIVAVVLASDSKTSTSRLLAITRFAGARRFDVWEVAW